MDSYCINVISAIFWLFCGYSLYTALVTFFRVDNWGLVVFQNLRKPLLISLYFILPCAALFALRRTFDYLPETIFWLAWFGIVGLSFFLMLYILTVPDWPIGRLTQIHKVPLFFIRFLLSVNFALSLLVTVMALYILFRVPSQVKATHGTDLIALKTQAAKADDEQKQKLEQIRAIRQGSTAKILNEGIDLLKSAVTCATTIGTAFASYKLLSKGESRRTKHGESARSRRPNRRR